MKVCKIGSIKNLSIPIDKYETWHQLDLNMKDRVKSTKNEISIISRDLNPGLPTSQSAALPFVLSHHI